MKKLERDWLTEGIIDFEYKKYVLLAYLKDIRSRFNKTELYPFMSDLVFHYRNILRIKENKDLLFENFPKEVSHADFDKLKISYRNMIEDDDVMKEMHDIISFAIPQLERALEEGKELFDFVEEQIELEPVGVTPIYSDEGYLFINLDKNTDIVIFRYQLTFFQHANEKYRSMSTTFVGNEIRSVSKTFETLKIEMTRRFKELPNPATYLANIKMKFPINETILPVTKRMLVREISS